jgi:hypothetical protein
MLENTGVGRAGAVTRSARTHATTPGRRAQLDEKVVVCTEAKAGISWRRWLGRSWEDPVVKGRNQTQSHANAGPAKSLKP